MHSIHCILATIKQKVFSLLPLPAKQHLNAAIKLSLEYYKVDNSIYWNTSKASVKRQVRSQLAKLAFNCYSAMINLVNTLNNYANNQTSTEPQWWKQINTNLSMAFDHIQKYHSHQIYSQQLELPLHENISNNTRNNSQRNSNSVRNDRPKKQRKASQMAA